MYTAKSRLVIDNTLASDNHILDVGCGTGATAKAIKTAYTDCKIVGINYSQNELNVAHKWLDESIVFDLNTTAPLIIDGEFNLIICSHILEHLVNPSERVTQLAKYLCPTGRMILVVPNFAIWKARLNLLLGKFEYAEHGLYDRTHLRFFTWDTFPKEVMPEGFEIIKRHYSGNFPMPGIRRILPKLITENIDDFFLRHFPNLFSSEVCLIIKKVS